MLVFGSGCGGNCVVDLRFGRIGITFGSCDLIVCVGFGCWLVVGIVSCD